MINWSDLIRYLIPSNVFVDESQVVFHYAPFHAADSITHGFTCLNGGATFYHKHFRWFKDKTEGEEIDSIYKKALYLMNEQHHMSDKMYNFLLGLKANDEFQIYLDENGVVTHVTTNVLIPYICCFSKEKDDEYMWKEYLKNSPNGFSIGIQLSEIKEETNKAYGSGYKHIMLEVIYNEEDKISFIKAFLEKLLLDENKLSYNQIKYRVISFLNFNRFKFKSHDYYREKEIRSILYIKENDDQFAYVDDKKIISFTFDWAPILEMVYFGEPNSLVEQIDCCHYSKHLNH